MTIRVRFPEIQKCRSLFAKIIIFEITSWAGRRSKKIGFSVFQIHINFVMNYGQLRLQRMVPDGITDVVLSELFDSNHRCAHQRQMTAINAILVQLGLIKVSFTPFPPVSRPSSHHGDFSISRLIAFHFKIIRPSEAMHSLYRQFVVSCSSYEKCTVSYTFVHAMYSDVFLVLLIYVELFLGRAMYGELSL